MPKTCSRKKYTDCVVASGCTYRDGKCRTKKKSRKSRSSKSRSRSRKSRSRSRKSRSRKSHVKLLSSQRFNQSVLDSLLQNARKKSSRSHKKSSRSRSSKKSSRSRKSTKAQLATDRKREAHKIVDSYRKVKIACPRKTKVSSGACYGKSCNDPKSKDYNDECCTAARTGCKDSKGSYMDCTTNPKSDTYNTNCCTRARLCSKRNTNGEFDTVNVGYNTNVTKPIKSKTRHALRIPKRGRVRCPSRCDPKSQSLEAIICRENQARCALREKSRKNNMELKKRGGSYSAMYVNKEDELNKGEFLTPYDYNYYA